ncbi:MAG: tyrosine-type recombinase/integrase [Gammaproteobacteria bacterium]
MPLTDTAIRSTKPGEKPKKLFDGGGLYLEVAPNGGKWWRFKYRFQGLEKRISLGVYPEIGLKDARSRREEARKQVALGIDPSQKRQAEKAATNGAGTFEAVAREWHSKLGANWAASTREKILVRLEQDAFPWIGNKSITQVTAPDLLSLLQRIEARGANETAHRIRQYCGQVFRFAIATGRADRDPAADLRGALVPTRQKHHASITDPKAVGALMRAIDAFQGAPTTRAALRLAPLVFVRPGELRAAQWAEIDTAAAEWRIPAERMKMRDAHIVPLSTQAVAILEEQRPITGRGRFVFPSIRTWSRPMSENTINAALRRLGYTKDEMTGHGFRSTASTLLNEQGWNPDAIERQLAHAERDGVRAAYNRAEHLPERRRMMQAWADYLDCLKRDAEVIPLFKTA